jgi:hypothetical protein
MSGTTEQTASTATLTDNSQSIAPATSALSSNLAELAKGQPDTAVQGAAATTTHHADPLSQNKGKDEKTGDIKPLSTEEADYELELPKDSTLTEEDLNEIVKIAEEQNLNKVQAEKLLAERESMLKKGFSKAEAKIQEGYKKAQQELLNHESFKGENRTKSFESIQRAVQTFGDQSLIDALNKPDVGNNLAVALFLKKIGDMIAPDSIEGKGNLLGGAQTEQAKEQALKKLYPDFYKNS